MVRHASLLRGSVPSGPKASRTSRLDSSKSACAGNEGDAVDKAEES